MNRMNTNPYTGKPYTQAEMDASAAANAREQAATAYNTANTRTYQTMNGPMTSSIFGGTYGAQNRALWDSNYDAAQRAKAYETDPSNPNNQAEAAKKEMFDLSQGGIDRLKNDSTDTMIRDYLKNQMSNQVLDPANKPFANGAPQYTASQAQAQNWAAAQTGRADQIGGGGPWDSTSRAAYMTDATDRAASGEAARNQMIRDAILQSGGNASDPSLAASMAESLSQRNDATARAGNQLNMRATSDNFNAQRQADLANQGANMATNQYNASNRQQAGANNAALAQQTQFANQGANNQAGMFNVGNQMQAQQQNFNAGNQALMYNNQNQNQANSQLAGYNNQRLGMLAGAENNKIGLLGQQRFEVPGGGQPSGGFMPSFQQYQQQPQRPAAQTYQSTYQNPSTAGGLTGSVWAGSGRPSTGSGMTTSSFGPTQVGNPYGAGASVGTSQPAVGQAPVQGVPNLLARPPAQFNTLAPQVKKPQQPNDYGMGW